MKKIIVLYFSMAQKNRPLTYAAGNLILLPAKLFFGIAASFVSRKVRILIWLIIILTLAIIWVIFQFVLKNEAIKEPVKIEAGQETSLDGIKAKVLAVPYFNQYLDPDGSLNPQFGNSMCGAASAVMIAGYFGKLSFNKENGQDLKRYMSQDEGQNLPNYCNTGVAGAFGVTGKFYNCAYSSGAGIAEYLNRYDLQPELSSWSIEAIKESIDQGYPLYMATIQPYFHVAVIKGYTEDGRVVMNDPYRDMLKEGSEFNFNGKNALYNLSDPKIQIQFIAKVRPN